MHGSTVETPQRNGGQPDKKSDKLDTSKYKDTTWKEYWTAKVAAVNAWNVASEAADRVEAEEQSASESPFLPGGCKCLKLESVTSHVWTPPALAAWTLKSACMPSGPVLLQCPCKLLYASSVTQARAFLADLLPCLCR